jgi:hypothetical protein
MDNHTTLESSLAQIESMADSALKTAASLQSELKKAKNAASCGAVRDMVKNLDTAAQLADATRVAVAELSSSWKVDERSYLQSDAYVTELREEAVKQGVNGAYNDGRFLVYPSILRVLPSDSSVEVNRKRDRRIRPSFVIAQLKRMQTKQPGFRPDQFLETLYKAYVLALGKDARVSGTVARLVDIYDVLTLLPQAKDYSKQEFARDLLLLDRSGVQSTKGHSLLFAASTGTKGSAVLSTVTPEGELKMYYGVQFQR